jgi:hypothetical protein
VSGVGGGDKGPLRGPRVSQAQFSLDVTVLADTKSALTQIEKLTWLLEDLRPIREQIDGLLMEIQYGSDMLLSLDEIEHLITAEIINAAGYAFRSLESQE